MNINSVIPSRCNFLFGAEGSQVFPLDKMTMPNGVDKNQFVERCLELAMRVHVHLFTHHDAIMLLDPRAYNKQCQLYALRICQIQREYPHKTDEEKHARTEENAFLHLAFFLNYEFRERINYVGTILSTIARMEIAPFDDQFSLHGFKLFLKDQNRSLENASRLAFNRIFEKHTREVIGSTDASIPLNRELAALSQEPLRIAGTSLGVKSEALYTYPKLSGLAYLVDALARDNIRFILKVKVVNEKGYGGIVRYASGPIGEKDPVVVFSGYATDGSVAVQKAMDAAKRCPTYLYRNSQRNTRHKDDESCFFCTPIEMDLRAQQERLDRVMANNSDILFALGSEFMMQEQKEFLPFFNNADKFPELKNLFDQSAAKLKELEFETNGVRSLAIYHTYTEIGKTALTDEFALDFSPERFLKEKGLTCKNPLPNRLQDYCDQKFAAYMSENNVTALSKAERRTIMARCATELAEQGFHTMKAKR